MIRTIALILGVLALFSMFIPTEMSGATEIGFNPPDPDPNTYQRSWILGKPMGWIEWGTSTNALHDPPTDRFVRFRAANFLVHLAAAAVFMGIYFIRKPATKS